MVVPRASHLPLGSLIFGHSLHALTIFDLVRRLQEMRFRMADEVFTRIFDGLVRRAGAHLADRALVPRSISGL